MRVSTLTHTYPRFIDDINAPFVEHLMETIAGLGVDVSVLTAYDPEWRRTPDDGHTVDLSTYKYIWPDAMHILGYSRTIEGNVRFRKRVMALSPFLFAGAYRSFLQSVRQRQPDVLHAHWILPNGYIAGRVSKKTGIPLIIQTHGSDIFTAEKNPLFRKMALYAGRQAACITAPSPDMINRLVALGINRDKMKLVPNAVQADFGSHVSKNARQDLKKTLGIPEENLVVLAMGRMVYVKGFKYLIDAFRQVTSSTKNVTLVLAGGGVLYEDIMKMTHEMGIDSSVVLPGAVMRDEVPVYFRMADMFVVPSIRHESGAVDGLPVVVPEAMAAGLPLVASDLSGIPVLIRDGYNGYLVPERDSTAIADAIMRLISNPSERKMYGERSKNIIHNHVNYSTVARYYNDLYERIAVAHVPASDIPGFNIPMETV